MSSSPNDFSYNKRIDGQIGSKGLKKLVWRIGIEDRLFQENQAQDCQAIEELRRICCEETDRARQARTDELSMHQERDPIAVRNVFERPPAQEGRPSTFFNNSKNLASSSQELILQELQRDRRVK